MTSKALLARAGKVGPAPLGAIVLALTGRARLAATTMHANPPAPDGLDQALEAAAQQAEHATALLDAVRGAHPLTCRLTTRALENRWGSMHAGMPGPESIGAAGDTAFEWAVSGVVGPALVPLLRSSLADADGCVRRVAAALLGHADVPALGAELRAELASASATTRAGALLAIGHAGKPADVGPAAAALSDPDPAVKLAAIWALGMIGDPAAVQPLNRMLEERDPTLRAAAALSLGQTESTEAIPALAALLGEDGDARVRRAAAAALGQIDH